MKKKKKYIYINLESGYAQMIGKTDYWAKVDSVTNYKNFFQGE